VAVGFQNDWGMQKSTPKKFGTAQRPSRKKKKKKRRIRQNFVQCETWKKERGGGETYGLSVHFATRNKSRGGKRGFWWNLSFKAQHRATLRGNHWKFVGAALVPFGKTGSVSKACVASKEETPKLFRRNEG